MKNTKLKVLVVTLAVCLLAMGSLGTLAWFTAEDSVTNQFLIADSDDDPDEIFSIDVWEDKTPDDPDGEEKIQDGIKYEDIQPGDDRYKEVNIENTGYYDQYVRATVTITGADVWYDVFDEFFFDLKNFATDLNADFTVDRIEFNVDDNYIAYTLYYNNILKSGEVVTLFTNVHIAELLNQYQAAELVDNKFDIDVKAEAVQTENVKDNAKDSFEFVEMGKESGNFFVADSAEGAKKLAKWLNPDVTGLLFNSGDDVSLDFSETNETIEGVPYIKTTGKLEVIEGTANVGTPTDYGFITVGADAETVINGTDITSGGGGVAAADGAKVTFNDGSVYVSTKSTSGRYIFYAEGAGSEIVINDGKFSWATTDNQKRAYVYAGAGTTVIINGGTFGKASTRSGYTAGILGEGTIIINGGTFGFDPTAWVDTVNYNVVYDSTAKTWTVVAK